MDLYFYTIFNAFGNILEYENTMQYLKSIWTISQIKCEQKVKPNRVLNSFVKTYGPHVQHNALIVNIPPTMRQVMAVEFNLQNEG